MRFQQATAGALTTAVLAAAGVVIEAAANPAIAPAIAQATPQDSAEATLAISAPELAPELAPDYSYEPLTEQDTTAEYWHQVGVNAVLANDWINALAALDKAVDLSLASDPEILEQRGWVHHRLGNPALATADLRATAALYLEAENYDAYLDARRTLAYVSSSASSL